jgi:5-formyltetrahydrofolate cyclo-ligase
VGPNFLPKARLRRHFRQVRQGVDRSLVEQKIVAHLASQPRLLAAKTILAYVAFGSEVDLGSLFALFPEKRWGIPRCLPQRQLRWHRYHPAELVPNRWGLLEPSPSSEVIDPAEAELILVPALACDRWGRRLAMAAAITTAFWPRCRIPACPSGALSRRPAYWSSLCLRIPGISAWTGSRPRRGFTGRGIP